ncbi:MAG: hypothetical protein D6725_10225 [Planctomycetota bacterium]|nr:MAG: hypothetical protein D6725_10225 [Planctomycetota bacterium]
MLSSAGTVPVLVGALGDDVLVEWLESPPDELSEVLASELVREIELRSSSQLLWPEAPWTSIAAEIAIANFDDPALRPDLDTSAYHFHFLCSVDDYAIDAFYRSFSAAVGEIADALSLPSELAWHLLSRTAFFSAVPVDRLLCATRFFAEHEDYFPPSDDFQQKFARAVTIAGAAAFLSASDILVLLEKVLAHANDDPELRLVIPTLATLAVRPAQHILKALGAIPTARGFESSGPRLEDVKQKLTLLTGTRSTHELLSKICAVAREFGCAEDDAERIIELIRPLVDAESTPLANSNVLFRALSDLPRVVYGDRELQSPEETVDKIAPVFHKQLLRALESADRRRSAQRAADYLIAHLDDFVGSQETQALAAAILGQFSHDTRETSS